MIQKHIDAVCRLLGSLLVFVLLQLGAAGMVQAQQTGADFDHSATGFVLTVAHLSARCETCHLKGVFKGTPKDCQSCHGWNNPRAATVMPISHARGHTAPCESCHQSNQPVFTSAGFPPNHIPASPNATCASCHVTGDFSVMPSVTAIHANAAPYATCATCHENASRYPMNPPIVAPAANHIGMNGQNCAACHVGPGSSLQLPVVDGARFSGALFNHGGVTTGCSTCHGPQVNSGTFQGISSIVVMPDSSAPGPNAHIPSSTTCEACHVGSMPSGQIAPVATSMVPGTGFQLPKPTSNQIHAGVTSNCSSCHDTNLQWVGMTMYPIAGYGGFQTRPQGTAGQFNVADANHPLDGDCSQCHAGISFDPSNLKKPSNHIPTASVGCNACHNMANFSVMPSLTNIHANAPSSTTNCAQCHSKDNATLYSIKGMSPVIVSPPGNHVDQGALGCENCHVGSNSSLILPVQDGAKFSNSAFSHSGINSNCAKCHGSNVTSDTFAGLSAIVSTATLTQPHIPVSGTVGCEVCHAGSIPTQLVPSSGYVGTPNFSGAKFTHSALDSKAKCQDCHGAASTGTAYAGIAINAIARMPDTTPGSASSHLPTSDASCANCHQASTPAGLINGIYTGTTPTGFRLPAPSASVIHNGITGNCSSCHDQSVGWIGMDLYPRSPAAFVPNAPNTQYTGFQTRPKTSATGYSVANPSHQTGNLATGDCSQCHGSFAYFGQPTLPAGHIPYAASASCEACHTTWGTSPAVDKIHANIQSTSSNCAQCHSAANAAQYAATTTRNPIVTPNSVSGHVPMGALGCENCHVGANSSMAATPVPLGAKFSNSAFSHSGISSGCDTCHGSKVTPGTFFGVSPKTNTGLAPAHIGFNDKAGCETCHVNSIPSMLIPASGATAGMTKFSGAQFSHAAIDSGVDCVACHGPNVTGSTFFGITNIIVMPPTSPPAATSHLPTSTDCKACHAGSLPSTLVPGNATRSVGSSGFQLPAPTAAMIHAGVKDNCSSCHETNYDWLGMNLAVYANTTAAPFKGFQTRPQNQAGNHFVADRSHPLTGDCSQCHGDFANFNGPSAPANHIPYATGAACAACHGDFSAIPTVAATHSNIQSTSSNCAQCHSAANAAQYASTTTRNPIVTQESVPRHISMGVLSCESCHVGPNAGIATTPIGNGAKFSNGAFSHSGIVNGCATCHGSSVAADTFYGVTPKTWNGLTPQHVPNPANASCETCHTNSIPSTPVPSTGATGSITTFANAKFSHSGITKDCATCHGAAIGGNSFYGISNIVVIPPMGIPGASSHLPSNASCETCHAGSVPTTPVAANATTSAPGTAFQNPVPTAAMIHTGVTGNCVSCHETNYVWMGMGKYPITTSAPFKGFQTRPQATAGTFFVADASHPNGECSDCHGGFANFNGPSAPSNHIPYAPSAQCSTCHGNFSALPTIGKIHANIVNTSTSCADCHSVAKSAYYSANMKQVIKTVPAKHIPMGSAGCETCHVGAGSSITTTPVPDGASFANSLFSHTGANVGCDICHGSTVATDTYFGIYPKTIGSLSPGHVPTTAKQTCDTCHVGSVPSGLVPSAGMTTFVNGKFSHVGITTGCAACHGSGITGSTFYGISSIVVLPQTSPAGTASHIPAPNNATCEACHSANTPSGLVNGNAASTTPGQTGFFSPAPSSAQIHSGGTLSCVTCHETTMTWMGMSKYPRVPSVKVTGSATPTYYTGFQTRPSTAGAGNSIQDSSHDQGDLGTMECSQCHNGFNYFGAPVAPANHIPYKSGVACGACHTSFATAPVAAGNSAMHANFQSNTTNCGQCHSVSNAAQYASTTTAHPITTPGGNHVPMGSLGCENCHVASNTTSTFSSFANGSFSHSGIVSSCGNCHGINVKSDTFQGLPSIVATGTLTPGHIPVNNNTSCEICHANSIPSQLVPASGYTGTPKFSGAKFTHSGVQSTSSCQDCHGPASSGVPYAGIGVNDIVRMPPTTPGLASSHMPTSVACTNCHQASTPAGLINGVYTGTTPTGFRLPAPSSAMVHAGVTAGCSSCHDQSVGWVGVSVYVRSPSVFVANAPLTQYTGFQTRPQNSATGYSVGNPSHQTGNLATGDCSQCHGSFAYFGQPTLPSGHIPFNTAKNCDVCHTNWGVAPTNAAIHANIQSTTANCAQCHSTANAPLYAATISRVGGIKAPSTTAPAHIPMRNLGCEACHIASLGTWTSFGSAQFSHSGMTTNCAECHGNGVGTFEGLSVTDIVKMPLTTPTNTGTAHFPVTTTCESCHLGSMPSALVPGKVGSGLGVGFRTPAPTATAIHSGVSKCNSCHEKNMLWVSMNQYPITTAAPYKGFQTRPYGNPVNPSFTINDSVHPGGGDCSDCHTGYTEWKAQVMPTNHIPTATTSTCANCHKAVAGVTNYSTMPAWIDIHTYAPSKTTNCAQCHATTSYNTATMTIKAADNSHIPMAALGCEACHVGANSSITSTPVGNSASFSNSAFDHSGSSTVCANCHGSSVTNTTFQGGQIPKTMAGLAPVHVPNPASLDCAACHTAVPTGQVRLGTATVTFANGKFSHSGVTTNCAQCHGAGVSGTSFYGISRIVALTNYSAGSGTNSHIPAPNNGTCEACHLGNTPSAPSTANATVAAVAWNGASGFYTPAPTTTQIHSALGSTTCVTCHESGLTWSGMAKYPRTPSTLTANATYTGFHGRPVAGGAVNSIADPNHPTTGDCSKCHGSTTSFSVAAMPSNHIPIGTTASCIACHTNITATNKDFSVPPTVANIHAYGPATTVSDCGQCHSATKAATYSRTAAPAYTVVGAGAGPASTSLHVPYGTTNCTVCHTAAATLNYTSFANGRFSHSGITTGCATCHGGAVAGFQGIPLTKLVVATSSATQGINNHIPFTAACEVCHAGSVPAIMDIPATKPTYGATGFRNSPPTSTMTHTGITKNCQVCHEMGNKWAGMDLYPINPSTITANGLYKGFQMRPYGGAAPGSYSVADPGHDAQGMNSGTDCAQCHVGTVAFTGTGKPDGHIPTSLTCTTCHIVAGNYSTTGLATVATLHTGITPTRTAPPTKPSTSCVSCHSTASPNTLAFAGCIPPAACTVPAGLVYYPKGVGGNPINSATGAIKHVPTSTLDCVACHNSVTAFGGTSMGSTGHTNAENTGKIECQSCHLDETATMKNATGGTTTNYSATSFAGGPRRRPSSKHSGSATMAYPNDCNNSGCHSYSKGFRALRRPVMREAVVSPNMGRGRPSLQNGKISRGTLGTNFDHVGVKPGQCKTCHDGKSASGMPARHLMVSTSCDTCHRPTSWLPAQFSHNGVTPNTCHVCHNGMSASAKPNGHFMTARSCDSCHKDMAWKPVNYQHLSPNYKPSPDSLTCVSCHVTNGELVPRQMRGSTRPKPLPVGP